MSEASKRDKDGETNDRMLHGSARATRDSCLKSTNSRKLDASEYLPSWRRGLYSNFILSELPPLNQIILPIGASIIVSLERVSQWRTLLVSFMI